VYEIQGMLMKYYNFTAQDLHYICNHLTVSNFKTRVGNTSSLSKAWSF